MGSPRKVVTAVAGLAVCAWIPRRSDRFPSATLTWVRDWSGTHPPQTSAAVKWLAEDRGGLIFSAARARTTAVTWTEAATYRS